MLANPKWFSRRKYGGWGLTPKTWQGWVYIGVFMLLVAGTSGLGMIFSLSEKVISIVSLILVGFLVLDVVDVMGKIDKDERETQQEALSERNAAWVMVTVLVIGILYQSLVSSIDGYMRVDPFLIMALAGGVIAKSLSNWYLRGR